MTSEKAEGRVSHPAPTETAAAGTKACGESYPDEPTLGDSGELDIPAHLLHPAEADLKLWANRLRGEHWWIGAVRAGRPCCPRCYRETWAEEWSA